MQTWSVSFLCSHFNFFSTYCAFNNTHIPRFKITEDGGFGCCQSFWPIFMFLFLFLVVIIIMIPRGFLLLTTICRMRNRAKWVSANSLAWLISRSLGRKLLFLFLLTNAQLDLTKRKMLSNGSANMKHSEAFQQHVVQAFSCLNCF